MTGFTAIEYNVAHLIGESHPSRCGTQHESVGLSSMTQSNTFCPNGSKIYNNLLRTRRCFTTSHMHIYSIPPMSRMNFAQKRAPTGRWVDPRWQMTFFETTTSYRTFWTQHCFQIQCSTYNRTLSRRWQMTGFTAIEYNVAHFGSRTLSRRWQMTGLQNPWQLS